MNWQVVVRVSSAQGFEPQTGQQSSHLSAIGTYRRWSHFIVVGKNFKILKAISQIITSKSSPLKLHLNIFSFLPSRVYPSWIDLSLTVNSDSLALFRNKQTVSCRQSELLLIHSYCRGSLLRDSERKRWEGKTRTDFFDYYTDRLLGHTKSQDKDLESIPVAKSKHHFVVLLSLSAHIQTPLPVKVIRQRIIAFLHLLYNTSHSVFIL